MAEIRGLTVLDDPVCEECDFRFMCNFYCMAEPREKGPCEYYEVNRWILTEGQGISIDQEKVNGTYLRPWTFTYLSTLRRTCCPRSRPSQWR